MARILALLVVLGFAVTIAQAGVVGIWDCERDNFVANYQTENNWNCGLTWNWRFSKWKQEGTYYCDWSADDLAELDAYLAAGTGDPNTEYVVAVGVYGTSYAGVYKTTGVQTLDSMTDWAEGDRNKEDPPAGVDGATGYLANANGDVKWKTAVQGDAGREVDHFWELPSQKTNTREMAGIWLNGSGTVDNMNTVVLDADLVDWLIDSPYCRGLRFFGTSGGGPDFPENAGVAAIGQWNGGAKLILLEVPEPATMMLLAIGGVGVLLRKKR